MGQSVRTLKVTEVITGSTVWKTIGMTGGDVQRIENPHAFHKLGHLGFHALLNSVRQIPKQPSQAVAPDLLVVLQMQTLECLLDSLVGCKAGPFMVSMGSTQLGLLKILMSLVQPV